MVTRRLYDKAVGTARSPSLAPLAGDARLPTSTRSTSTGSASAVAPRSDSWPRGAASCWRSSPTPACARGSIEVPYNVDGSTVGEIIDIAAPAIDVRLERL